MGLRDQAESDEEKATKLNFHDAANVPSWAVGYVTVALENDLFAESDTNVNPNQPADRLWATTLLVKALKLSGRSRSQYERTASLSPTHPAYLLDRLDTSRYCRQRTRKWFRGQYLPPQTARNSRGNCRVTRSRRQPIA